MATKTNSTEIGVDVIKREQQFHDDWADTISPGDVQVLQAFTGCTSPEGAWIIQQLGDLRGKRVLEMGTGAGEGATFFALQGADVVATDISSGMLRVAEKVAKKHGTQIKTMMQSAENLSGFPNASFDVVYAANVLHHVDIARCLDEVNRVLRPGGRAAFWDPVAHNPVINIYRRMATSVRTPDEHPICRRDIALFYKYFHEISYQFFWFTSLAVFLKFYLIDRVHPSSDRYWKRILTHENELRGFIRPLMSIDRFVLRVFPWLGWWCWNIAVVAKKRD